MERRGGRSYSTTNPPHNRRLERIIIFVLVPVLLLSSIFLPPLSLGNRLFPTDRHLVTVDEGGTVPGPNGVTLTVPANAVAKRTRMSVEALDSAALAAAKPDAPEALAAKSMPTDVIVHGALYRVSTRQPLPAQAFLRMATPGDLIATEKADLYGWDGSTWRWLPSQVSADDTTITASLEPVPSLIMVGQSSPAAPRMAVTANALALADSSQAVSQVAASLNASVVTVSGLALSGDGRVTGQPPSADQVKALGQSSVWLSISNTIDGVVRNDLSDNIIVNESSRRDHVQAILAALQGQPYGGVQIDYRKTDPNLRAEFTTFAGELAQALHATNQVLAVRVDAPVLDGENWNTGAYDWQALGQIADWVHIPALADPTAYAKDGAMDQMVRWAVSQIDRRKIDLSLTTYAYDQVGGQEVVMPYEEAIGLMAQGVSTDDPDRLLAPGQSINVTLSGADKAALDFNSEAQVYTFTYADQAGKQHSIRLENASSVSRKLQYATYFGLGGASIDGVLDPRNDQNVIQVVQSFQENLTPPEPRFAYVWTVEDASGKALDQKVMSVDNPQMSWTAPNNPGNYIIRAAVSDDGGETSLSAGPQLDVQVPTPTFTPTNTPTNTPTSTPTVTNTPTPRPTNTRPPTPTIDPNAPTATPRPTAAAAAPAEAPAVAPGLAGGYFGYGLQADMITDGNHARILEHVKGMGFGWVKQQVEWFRYNPAPGQYDWGALDRIVESANAYGVNVMFSVVKAPKWARPPGDTHEGPPADPGTYATFVREMAARYKGRVRAYEIWNEQNLYYEWGGHGNKLNAARYVQLLAGAYNAIKSVDPSAVVISGALTPTGVNDGNTAIDDRAYLEQMYQAGLARYCDAVGAHPSGYNNPPDADWRNWSDASAPSFKGHPSFFFRGTMEGYRNIMVKYGDGRKRIWVTEFGWSTVENVGAGPAGGYEYAADNSEGEQAQYLVRAYQIGRGWGWVGPMFLWNLNFGPVSGKSDEKAGFGIVRPDWSPRPAFSALRDMPK